MSNYNEEIHDLDEGSLAMDSLKPNSHPTKDDPKSKVEMLNKMIGAAHTMKSDELTKWFDQAMALIGKEASHLPGHANEKSNENSIRMKPSHATGKGGASVNMPMPKLSVKEDVEDIFVGSDLSEEFKEKASVLFEAAINSRIMLEQARLEEEFEAAINETIEEIHEEMTSKVDSYLDYVVENWMKENEVAIESTLRNELAEEFMGGLKNLFVEHYIDLPQEKVDVVESLADKVETLEAQLDQLISENTQLKEGYVEVEKESIVESFLEDLAFSQQEKFKALAEGIDFDGDLDTYARKLSIIKENYFGVEQRPAVSSNIMEESFEGETEAQTVSLDPAVSKYVQAISRSIKR